MRSVQHEIDRLRAEFNEMPGLRLTMAQAQRLCGLEEMLCASVLDSLVVAKFLDRDQDGVYTRVTDGRQSYGRPARPSAQRAQ
jgi:hypothetical protein